MKAFSIIFAAVGSALLVVAALLYQHTRSFIGEATTAQGTVIELQPVRSDGSTTYRPVVRFKDQRGETIEFSSSSSSSPPSYSRGEIVTVLYRPGNPQDAQIDGFFSLWGGSVIVAGLGSVFGLIGGGIIVGRRFIRVRDEGLRRSGTPIETEFQSVQLNTAIEVNGRHPFRVLTQWQNPATSQIHVFHSHNLWFDPTKYLTEKQITVYIQPGNPKKYYVDLSFLPQLAT